MRSFATFAVVASGILLAACARTPPPTQDVTVSLATLSCDQAFTTSRAKPVGLDPEDPVAIEFDIQHSSPCKLDTASNKQLYEVVRLPSADSPYLLTISSPKIGGSAFAPTVATLSQTEDVRRIYAHDAFLNRGNKLSLSIEAAPEDRFLVVSSHADIVGDQRSEITTHITSQSHYNAVSGISTNLYYGSESQRGYTMSYTGKVIVTTMPAPSRALEPPSSRPSTEKR